MARNRLNHHYLSFHYLSHIPYSIIKIFRLNFWSFDCESGVDEEYDTFVDICCVGSKYESDINNVYKDDFRNWSNELPKAEEKIILGEE